MKKMLARTFASAVLLLGIASTAFGQSKLNNLGNVGGGVTLMDHQTVFHYGPVNKEGEWLTAGLAWNSSKIAPYGQDLREAVYDPKRKRLVGTRGAALGILTQTVTGWTWTSIPISGPTHPQGRVSIDMRDPGSDPRKAPIYFRAWNGHIYVREFVQVLSVPVSIFAWKLNEVTNTPGGDPVFDNFNMNERSLFFRASDNTLRRSVYNTNTQQWTTFTLPSDPVVSDPVVNTSMSVVYCNSSHRVASTWWNGVAWSAAQWNPTSNVASRLAIGTDQGAVYYTDAGNNLWKCAWGGSSFVSTQLTTIGNVRLNSLAVNNLGQVYYRGMDNCLWRY